jgi:hypothetical protein
MGDKMEVLLVFVFALILSTLILSAIVGDAANTRHRNAIGWFVLSVLITPLLAGLLLFALPIKQPARPLGVDRLEKIVGLAIVACAAPLLTLAIALFLQALFPAL